MYISIKKYLHYVFSIKFKPNIKLVIGDCGSGKTTYAVRKSQKYIKKNRPVYSNMYIKGAYKITLDDLMVKDLEENSLVIIDEASSYGLASRGDNHKKNNKQNIIEFFTMYRHYMVREIIVISPSFQDVLPIVRSRADKILCVKNSIYKMFGLGSYSIIKKKLKIKEDEPKELYYAIPLFRVYFNMYKTFSSFDTYSKKILEKVDWEKLKW